MDDVPEFPDLGGEYVDILEVGWTRDERAAYGCELQAGGWVCEEQILDRYGRWHYFWTFNPQLAPRGGGDWVWEECPTCRGDLLDGGASECVSCSAAAIVAHETGTPLRELLASSRVAREEYKEQWIAMTPEERGRSRERTRRKIEAEQSGVLPAFVEPLDVELEIAGRYLASDGDVLSGAVMRLDGRGVVWFDQATRIPFMQRAWTRIEAIRVEGPNEVQRRITAPRAMAVGLLAAAWGKEVTRSYAVLEACSGEEHFFEVPGTAFALRARLSTVTAWLNRNRDALRATGYESHPVVEIADAQTGGAVRPALHLRGGAPRD